MLPYWFLLGAFSSGAILLEGRQRSHEGRVTMLLAIAAVLATVMIGLRYKVGADWEPYRLIFWEMRFISLESAVGRSDPAFGLLNWLVRGAGLEFWVVNLVCGAIFMYGLTHFAARQTSPWLVMAVAVPYILIVVAMGYNRQATALGLVFLSLCAIQDRSFLRFAALMLLAATFHRSAILLLPIVAMSYSRNRFLTAGLALAATGIGYFFIVAPEIDTYINRYSGAEQGAIESEGTLVRLLMNAVPALIFLFMSRRFQVDEVTHTIWRNLSLLAVLSLAAYVYFGANTALDRVAVYLTPLQLYVFGNLPAIFGRSGSPSRPITLAIVGYASAIQSVWLIGASNARYWLPYQLFPL